METKLPFATIRNGFVSTSQRGQHIKGKYISELNRKRAIEDFEPSAEILIQSLPSKKRGQPLLLGSELDEQVKSYAKQKHLACKKVRGQSESALQTGRRDQNV